MRILSNLLNKILVPVLVEVDTILVGIGIIRPKIIMYMDGGLCSQMNFWRNGEYYAESGFDVYYDLRWFKTCGKGIDGVTERKYELQILWPHIEVKTLSSWKLTFYKYFLPWSEVSCVLPSIKCINRSVYFGGYTNLQPEDGLRLFHKHFSLDYVAWTPNMRLDSTKHYCGVHIRRGDLAGISLTHYPQVADGYFLRAIEYVQKKERVDEFLLFSDDPQWEKDNILPNVTSPCRVIEGNEGYEDIMLLAQCQVIISSQGSFGRTAALINPKCELFISNFTVENQTHLANRVLQIQ